MSTAGTSDQVRIVHWIASTRARTSMTGKDDWQKEIIRALRQSFQRVKRDVQVAHVIHASLAPLDAHFGAPVNSIACDPPFVTTLQGEVHEAVVEQAVAQLEAYAAANRGVFRTFGGSMTFGANGTRGNSRAPDGGFRPDGSSDNEDPVRPRIIVEVEVHHRGVPEAHRFCLEYFDLIPQLRAVLLLKIFPRRADGTFACLAILYRRRPQVPRAVDVVSFGSAPLSGETEGYILTRIAPRYRALPLAPLRNRALQNPQNLPNPWNAVQDSSFVRIPAADIFSQSLSPTTHRPIRLARFAVPPADLLLDLWPIYDAADWFTHI